MSMLVSGEGDVKKVDVGGDVKNVDGGGDGGGDGGDGRGGDGGGGGEIVTVSCAELTYVK
jgi:hypothetical protein